jgi:hypothetical protein
VLKKAPICLTIKSDNQPCLTIGQNGLPYTKLKYFFPFILVPDESKKDETVIQANINLKHNPDKKIGKRYHNKINCDV